MIEADRTNTILYTSNWPATVAFYRDVLRLPIVHENEWFVEFGVTPDGFVSVADARRTSIEAGTGAGITLSWRVADVASTRQRLVQAGVEVGQLARRWEADVIYLFDPAGNRIELWSPPDDPASGPAGTTT